MNSPYATTTTIDADLLAEYNAGVRSAVLANRDREKRERHLDSLYYWSGKTPRSKR